MTTTESPTRVPGKFGRKTAVFPTELKPLREYLKDGVTVAPVATGDVSGGITDWGMLGNDTHSDCEPACTYHNKMAKSAAAGTPETFTTDAVLAVYDEYCQKYNGGQDEGVVLSQWLAFLYSKGLILGYGSCTLEEATFFAQAGHGVHVGVDLTDSDQAEFSAGTEWTVAGGQVPDPNLGHAIMLAAWDHGATDPWDKYVTWGAEQQATTGWSAACAQEVWVAITTEDESFDLVALQADIETIPDAVVPNTVPPAPSPEPDPPAPVDPPAPAPVTPTPPPAPHQMPPWFHDFWEEAVAWFRHELGGKVDLTPLEEVAEAAADEVQEA